jgi:hypothetical protein
MNLPRFKRKWRIYVADNNSVAFDVSELHCIFNIEKNTNAINYADIEIYNLDPQFEQLVIRQGARVVVEAGYENGECGVIFDGDVIQPLWDRQDIVNRKLTLRCISGDKINNGNFVSITFESQQKQRDVVAQIAANSFTKFGVDHITNFLSDKKTERGMTFFGEPSDFLREIAISNDSAYSVIENKATIGRLTDQSNVQNAILIMPETGLIGVPTQTQDGISLRTLLNPNIKVTFPASLIALPTYVITQQKITIGQLQSRLDEKSLYKIMSVVYRGDTRGNDWYCDIVACNSDAQGLTPMMYETVMQARQ